MGYSVRYIPALDGLRALAIGIVVLHHSNAHALPGGWMGVDVFFVLSGYLITSILLNEIKQSGEISLRNFYIRRALRLTPPLVLLAIFQFGRAPFSHHPGEIVEGTIVALFYLENWNGVFHFAPWDAVGHTWSLATEEQFYWLWPLLLPLILRRRPIAWLVGASLFMAASRVIFWGLDAPYEFVQCFLGERPVGLLIGCALAFLPISEWRLSSGYGLAAIVALVALAFASETTQILFISAPLAASLATAVLIVCLQRPGLLTDCLSVGPVRYIGKISYGLYLYHLPIFIVGGITRAGSPLTHVVVAIAFSVLLATLSYEFVEKPILRLKSRFESRTAVGITAGQGLAARS
jgi:peptidoglycan/LPS O-acetylase OafA/YrhL